MLRASPPGGRLMAVVGLVTHSGAAQDVRRLTSLARTIDVHERVNVVARVLAGIAAVRGVRVLYPPEPTRVVERALAALAAIPDGARVDARPATERLARDARQTRDAAAALAVAGARCVVTYAGDGTNRAVAGGWPEAVMVPLAGGTNNAFALAVDPTTAGRAAALYATAPDAHAPAVRRRPHWTIDVPDRAPDPALVDVALVTDEWVGTHAVWDPDRLAEAVAVGDPTVPGLAGVAGTAVAADGAVHLRFGRPGRRVLAPLGPGQVVPVWVRQTRTLRDGDSVAMRGPGTLAIDGERELVLRPAEVARVRLEPDGPRVLDVAGVLRAHVRDRASADEIDARHPIRGGS